MNSIPNPPELANPPEPVNQLYIDLEMFRSRQRFPLNIRKLFPYKCQLKETTELD